MTTSDFSQVYFYNRMKEKYTELSGFVPDDASDICLRFGVLAGELETLCEKITALEGQYSPMESAGEVLERFAMMRGLARKPASFATGSLRLSRLAGDGTTVQVPSGVICKTPSGIRYKTTQSGTISPLGNNVVVSAVALEPVHLLKQALEGAVEVHLEGVECVRAQGQHIRFVAHSHSPLLFIRYI